MTNPTTPMTAADELRPYLDADPPPAHIGCGIVAQLLVEHDEQRDRAKKAEAEVARLRAGRQQSNGDADVRAVLRAIREIAAATNCRPAAVADALGRLNKQFASRIVELDENGDRGERKPVDIGTGMPATTHLEAFGQCLRDAFGTMPYHVGSSIHGKSWRDVDVRIMLDDDRFDALFPGYVGYRQRDAWWALVCAAISELGRQRTGLPIDFQVQRTTEANEKFPGARNPLFVGHAEDGHRPAMVGPRHAEERA
jgi:hypothetical protein